MKSLGLLNLLLRSKPGQLPKTKKALHRNWLSKLLGHFATMYVLTLFIQSWKTFFSHNQPMLIMINFIWINYITISHYNHNCYYMCKCTSWSFSSIVKIKPKKKNLNHVLSWKWENNSIFETEKIVGAFIMTLWNENHNVHIFQFKYAQALILWILNYLNQVQFVNKIK
jgi:hypothetical protein